MKWIFCLLIAAISLEAIKAMSESEAMETMKNVAGKCGEEADDQDYRDMMRNEKDVRQSTKCLRHCLMEKMDLMTNDCKMDEEKVVDIASMVMDGKEKQITEIVKTCNEKVVCKDKCDAAHDYAMCTLDEFTAKGWELPSLDKD